MSKRIMILAGAAALAFLSPGSAAAAEGEAPKIDVSKGGITIGSGDNTLTIGARFQGRWTADDKEQFDADTAGTGVGKEDGLSQQFAVQRMRIIFRGGAFRPWLKYDFQFELANTTGDKDNKIKDAFIDIDKNHLSVLRVGQFKSPFSLQQLTSSGKQQFVDRAITDGKFVPGRDQGIMLGGVTEKKKFGYQAGVFNGGGEGKGQDDQAFMYVGRVWFDPLGEYKLAESANDWPEKNIFHVGLACRTGEAIKGTETTGVFEHVNDETACGLELAWRYKRFFATGESYGMNNQVDNPTQADDIRSRGSHVQFGVMITKAMEVAIRGAMIEPDKDVDDADITESRLGWGYYFMGHNLKLQADAGTIKFGKNVGSLPATASRNLPALDAGKRLVSGEELTDVQYRVQIQIAFP